MAREERSLVAVEYLQHALDDADVRRNLARGAAAIRSAAGQLGTRGNRTSRATRRKRLQDQLREAVTSFGRVGAAAREAELARRRSRRRRRLALVLVAAGAGAGAAPSVRGKLRSTTENQDGEMGPVAAPTPAPPVAGA
jgi:hypothetical protein